MSDRDIEQLVDSIALSWTDRLTVRYDQTTRCGQFWLDGELIAHVPVDPPPELNDTLTLHWGGRAWDVTEGLPTR